MPVNQCILGGLACIQGLLYVAEPKTKYQVMAIFIATDAVRKKNTKIWSRELALKRATLSTSHHPCCVCIHPFQNSAKYKNRR